MTSQFAPASMACFGVRVRFLVVRLFRARADARGDELNSFEVELDGGRRFSRGEQNQTTQASLDRQLREAVSTCLPTLGSLPDFRERMGIHAGSTR